MVFKPVAPASNGNRLGVVQETIQNRTGSGHVAQKFAPFFQWPVAGHDGVPVFIPAHDYLKQMLPRVLGQLFQSEIVNYQKFRMEVTAQGSMGRGKVHHANVPQMRVNSDACGQRLLSRERRTIRGVASERQGDLAPPRQLRRRKDPDRILRGRDI